MGGGEVVSLLSCRQAEDAVGAGACAWRAGPLAGLPGCCWAAGVPTHGGSRSLGRCRWAASAQPPTHGAPLHSARPPSHPLPPAPLPPPRQDFLGELVKPADQQAVPVKELLRGEAVEVWQEVRACAQGVPGACGRVAKRSTVCAGLGHVRGELLPTPPTCSSLLPPPRTAVRRPARGERHALLRRLPSAQHAGRRTACWPAAGHDMLRSRAGCAGVHPILARAALTGGRAQVTDPTPLVCPEASSLEARPLGFQRPSRHPRSTRENPTHSFAHPEHCLPAARPPSAPISSPLLCVQPPVFPSPPLLWHLWTLRFILQPGRMLANEALPTSHRGNLSSPPLQLLLHAQCRPLCRRAGRGRPAAQLAPPPLHGAAQPGRHACCSCSCRCCCWRWPGRCGWRNRHCCSIGCGLRAAAALKQQPWVQAERGAAAAAHGRSHTRASSSRLRPAGGHLGQALLRAQRHGRQHRGPQIRWQRQRRRLGRQLVAALIRRDVAQLAACAGWNQVRGHAQRVPGGMGQLGQRQRRLQA